jgi:hypothetical protein
MRRDERYRNKIKEIIENGYDLAELVTPISEKSQNRHLEVQGEMGIDEKVRAFESEKNNSRKTHKVCGIQCAQKTETLAFRTQNVFGTLKHILYYVLPSVRNTRKQTGLRSRFFFS